VSKIYCSVLADYISEEIKFRAEELKDKINSSSGRAKQKAINALGVIYARNGLFDDAIDVLAPLASGSNVYSPSVLNLANLYYLTGKTELAVSYYKKASETMKNPAAAFLGLAMAEYKLGNSEAAEKAYSEFSVLAPDKAAKYEYLSGSRTELTRASSGLNNSDVLWVDEK
jgi:tetratricopeptide (TPR) repeat protein